MLGIAGEGDEETLRKISDLLVTVIAKKDPLPEVETVRRLVRAAALEHPLMDKEFDEFLAVKKRTVSRNTYRSYESHVRLLRPHLGKVRRDKLRVAHLDAMFEAIVENNDLIEQDRESGDPRKAAAVKWQRPVGPLSLHRIRETLRALLNRRGREGLLIVNVAVLVELPRAERPKPRRCGGARRAGSAGRTRSSTLVVSKWRTRSCSTGGKRSVQTQDPLVGGIVPLDPDTVLVLAAHLARQDEAKARLGSSWREHDLLFTRPDGSPPTSPTSSPG
ncbi:hypothetical protein [Amycolatopsis benzoatilytica]|uniref:hypothetical protein n=1 Tax=Amycolatopsis benzoatilytica TaxID=346045 RepID=UPI00039F55B9|nr:hypothetical protein [Amycolatopsis benzoatilytica]